MAVANPAFSVPKMADVVAGMLRSQIARKVLGGGDALPSEKELMEQFGVSRPTLREAIRILESEGLIRTTRGARGGAVVTTPDVSAAARQVGVLLQVQETTLADVYQARSVIELAAVAQLAQNRNPDDVAALRAQIEVSRACVDDMIATAQAASDFHLLLVERSGNTTMALIGNLLAELSVGTYLNALMLPPRFSHAQAKSIRSYEVLVDFIEAGEVAQAEEQWRKHMAAVAKGPAVQDPRSKVDVDRLAEVMRARSASTMSDETIARRSHVG